MKTETTHPILGRPPVHRGPVAKLLKDKDLGSMSPLELAILFLGGYQGTGRVCGVTFMTVGRWIKQGKLPRTELSGDTDYASKIEQALKGKITRDELLTSCFPNRHNSSLSAPLSGRSSGK